MDISVESHVTTPNSVSVCAEGDTYLELIEDVIRQAAEFFEGVDYVYFGQIAACPRQKGDKKYFAVVGVYDGPEETRNLQRYDVEQPFA